MLGLSTLASASLADDTNTVRLAADGVTAGTPVVESSTIEQEHVLSSNSIVTGVPIVNDSTIAQDHKIAGDSIFTGTPTLGTTILKIALFADSIVSGTPALESAVLVSVNPDNFRVSNTTYVRYAKDRVAMVHAAPNRVAYAQPQRSRKTTL